MTLQPGKETVALHMLLNMSRNKRNQHEKHFSWKILLGKLFSDPLVKSQNWPYLRINSLKLYTVCFCLYANRGLSKYIETKLQVTQLHDSDDHLIINIIAKSFQWNSTYVFTNLLHTKLYMKFCAIIYYNYITRYLFITL